MRLRHVPGAREEVAASPLVFDEAAAIAQQGHWQELFSSEARPLYLEVGMGRGRFINQSAAAYPDINFLGLELREEMIQTALERDGDCLPNLRFLWLDAQRLGEVFVPGEVSRLYLNFPDPWPKSRHAKRRLTGAAFLELYSKILGPEGELHFKTDNQELFTWSEESFIQSGWQILTSTRNLSDEDSGIFTEYEGRYRRQGKPICYLAARKEL